MKKYTKPEIEITAFTTEDIITASGGMDVLTEEEGVSPGFVIDLDGVKWE